MLCKSFPVCGKFNFCVLKLSEKCFSNIFDPHLAEPVNAGPADMEKPPAFINRNNYMCKYTLRI